MLGSAKEALGDRALHKTVASDVGGDPPLWGLWQAVPVALSVGQRLRDTFSQVDARGTEADPGLRAIFAGSSL